MRLRVLAISWGLAVAPAALAAEEEPGAVVVVEANVVEITVVGSEEELSRIRDATAAADFRGAEARWKRAERFERGTLLARAPGDPAVRVRAFVVISPGRAELFFADRSQERFLVRDITLANGLDSVGSDAVSQVLTLSIAALADDDKSGLSRSQTEKLLAPVPPPTTKPAAVVKPEPKPPADGGGSGRSFVGASVFYAVRAFGGGIPIQHGPGLRIGWISEAPRVEGELFVSGQYELPVDYETASVGVDLTSAVLRGGYVLSVLPSRGSRAKFGLGVAAGADLVNYTPRAGTTSGELELAPPGQTTVFALSLRFVAGFRLSSHFDASAALFTDIYPTRVSYALEQDEAAVNVLVPWRFRPGLALGLTLR